jgi:Tfp pilus assembly protein PilV
MGSRNRAVIGTRFALSTFAVTSPRSSPSGGEGERKKAAMSPAAELRRPRESGFSIVEGLIASVILLIVILGVLPLVSQSMVNNAQGNNATQEANASTDSIEQLLSLPFNAPAMTIAAGTSSLVADSYQLFDSSAWQGGVYTGSGTPQYRRTVTVEQFSVTDLDGETDFTLDTPLDGSTLPGSVGFKRIQVQIQSQRVFNSSSYRVLTVQGF